VSDVSYVVRRANQDDWVSLRSIRLEALGDTPDAFGSTYEDALGFSDDRWRAMAAQRCYFLSELDGEVMGMISGGLNDRHPGTHWMYGMYVTPSARGSGVAIQLVETVFEWARSEGATELYLHVTSTISRARAFYEKLGFELTGNHFTMTRDPRLELLTMRRSLVES
jgi:GNAT superfamily N-acetyltransferase